MKYVVVMKDPITGEEKNLTRPSAKQPTENSCRRFKEIGMKNIFVQESRRRVKKVKQPLKEMFEPLPETEQDWVNQIIKNMEK